MAGRPQVTRWAAAILGLAGFMVLVFIVFAAAFTFRLGPRDAVLAVTTVGWPRHFAVADWRAHPDKRYYMAFDLANSDLLRGKTKAQVLAMLGEPTEGSDDIMIWPVSYPGGPEVDALSVWITNGSVSGWSTSVDSEAGPLYH